VCGYKYSKISRVYAKLGRVWVEGHDGKERSLDPREAAIIALQLNSALPDEKSSKTVVLRLIDDIIKAARDAQVQRESPPDKDTKILTDTLLTNEMKNSMELDPKVFAMIKFYQTQFAMLDFAEVKSVVCNDKWSDDLKKDFLRLANKDRLDTFIKTQGRMLTKPI